MNNEQRPPTRTLGIDLGTTSTVIASQSSEDDCAVTVTPTSLAFTEAGILTGESAAQVDTAISPLPYSDDDREGERLDPDEPADNLPLTVFLGRGVAELESIDSVNDLHTVVTVPGVYTTEDCRAVERAARAAGFGEIISVRSPLAVAATELDRIAAPTTLVVVDVGSHWCDMAVVAIDPRDEMRILARRSLQQLGRNAFDASLARWVLDQVGAEHEATLEFDPGAIESVRVAAGDALAAVSEDDVDEASVSVTLELDEGVDVIDGGILGTETIDVDVPVDLFACYEALENHIETIRHELSELLADAGLDPTDVDELVTAGTGTEPVAIRHGIEGLVELAARDPAQGDRYTAPAIGAAILADRAANGEWPVEEETFDEDVELQVLGADGPKFHTLAAAGTPIERGSSVAVEAVADQMQGCVALWRRHPYTGERRHVSTILVSGIPASSDGRFEFSLGLDLDGPSALEDEPALVAVVDEASVPDGLTPELSVSRREVAELSWLVEPGVEPPVDTDTSDSRESAVERDPPREAIEKRASDDLVGLVHDVRTRLWGRGVVEESGFEPNEIEILLRELDSRLRALDFEIIEPDVGNQVDPDYHLVRATRESDRPEGEILELEMPGIAVDGRILEPARVVVARD